MTKSFVCCETCNKNFSGPEPFAEHLVSKGHMKKIKGKGLDNLPTSERPTGIIGQKYRCDVCEKDLSGQSQVQQHLNGSKHKSMLNKKRILVNVPEDQQQGAVLLQCETCEKCFSGPESYEDHIKSKKHERKVNMAQMKERITNQQPASCPPAPDIPETLNEQIGIYPTLPCTNAAIPSRASAEKNIKKKPTGCLSAFKSIMRKKKVH